MIANTSVRNPFCQLYEIRKIKSSEMNCYMELKNILRRSDIRIVFQPVVSLLDAVIIGYEALSRGPEGSILERPDALFSAAVKFDLIWELEYLCRGEALEKAKDIIPTSMLFLNVDPKIINDPRFQKGQTQDMLRKFRANSGNVIFEITEKTAISDYRSFCRILDNYTSQGYKIAIDDTGSGYSGLRTLAEIRPNFIKVDMELVRDIDKDNLKQSMMKALCDFSISTNSKIIAEGIETRDELSTLIGMGVHYGQGFFLQRPEPNFPKLAAAVKQTILDINRQKKRELYHTPLTMPVGEIAEKEQDFPPSTLGSIAIEYFSKHSTAQGIPVVENERSFGLLMKGKFLSSLATQYGIAVYMNRAISALVEKNPLIVDYNTPIEIVSKSALTRKEDDIYDYILVTKEEKYYGTVTVKKLLEKTTQLELNRARHANPLTGLPGNLIIEGELDRLLRETPDYAVLYFDLDNFKAYNDVYGFEYGDKVLCLTAEIIQEHLNCYNSDETFVGHIGGDDFIAITRFSDVSELCQGIISSFNSKIPNYYNNEDCDKGYVVAKNRHGQYEEYPLMSISIAVVTNRKCTYKTIFEISEAAGHVKKKCKLDWHSCYYIE